MHSALLVIDVQESFRARPDWQHMHNPRIAAQVNRVVDAARAAGDLVVCGICTEHWCETTTRVASDLGFGVTFVTDATTTSAIDGLSADEIIERTERVLAAREFARIATTDELVAAALASAP